MPPPQLTGCQVRAARAMLNWSVRQLAHRSGISDSSIRRIEAVFGVPDTVTLDLLTKVQDYFESKGFKFVWDDHDGPGIFWRRVERRRGVADRRGAGSGGGEGK